MVVVVEVVVVVVTSTVDGSDDDDGNHGNGDNGGSSDGVVSKIAVTKNHPTTLTEYGRVLYINNCREGLSRK